MLFFKKRKKQQQNIDEPFLTLPLLEKKDLSPATIAEYINKDIPIVAVFNVEKKMKWDINTLSRIQMNGLNPSVSMYRKEGNFLYNYRAFTSLGDGLLHFVLYYVYEYKNSNIMYLYNDELKDAAEIYYDKEKLMTKQIYYANDFSVEEGLEFFVKNPDKRCIYIGESRLVKKSDINTVPDV